MFLLRITAGVLIVAAALLCLVRSDNLIETQAGFSNNDGQPKHQDQDRGQQQLQDTSDSHQADAQLPSVSQTPEETDRISLDNDVPRENLLGGRQANSKPSDATPEVNSGDLVSNEIEEPKADETQQELDGAIMDPQEETRQRVRSKSDRPQMSAKMSPAGEPTMSNKLKSLLNQLGRRVGLLKDETKAGFNDNDGQPEHRDQDQDQGELQFQDTTDSHQADAQSPSVSQIAEETDQISVDNDVLGENLLVGTQANSEPSDATPETNSGDSVSNESGERDQKFDNFHRLFSEMKRELDEQDAKISELVEVHAENHELRSRLREAEDKIASLEANSHGEGVFVTVPEPDNTHEAWIETNYGKVESSSDGNSYVEATKRANRTLARQRETFKRAFNYLIVRVVEGDNRLKNIPEFPSGRLERVKELAVRINQFDQWIASKFQENVDNIVAMEAQGGDHSDENSFVEATKKAKDDFFRYRAYIMKEFNRIIPQIKGSGLEEYRMMYLRWIHIFNTVLDELVMEDFAEAVRNVVGLQALQRAQQTSS